MLNSFPQGDQTAIHDYPIVPLGTCVVDDQDDREWVYLKARAALTKGHALQASLNILGTGLDNLHTVAAGTRQITFTTAEITAANLTLLNRVADNSQNGEYLELYVHGGAGVGQQAIVVAKDDRVFDLWWDSDDGGLETALDATSDLELFAMWWAHAANNADGTIALAQADIAQDKYFWGLRKGRGVGVAHNAITANTSLKPTDVAGEIGQLEVTEAADVHNAIATSLVTAADDEEFPLIADINTHISQVLYSKAPYEQGYNRPS